MVKAALVLTAALSISALSAGTITAAAAVHHSTDSLVIKITKSEGSLWGHVSVDYKQNGKEKMLATCKATKCEYHPPHMVKLTLTETPTHASTWPFHSWTLVNGSKKAATSMGKTLKFEIVGGMATATANYVLK